MNSVWKTAFVIYLPVCLFASNQVYLFSSTEVVLNNYRRISQFALGSILESDFNLFLKAIISNLITFFPSKVLSLPTA